VRFGRGPGAGRLRLLPVLWAWVGFLPLPAAAGSGREVLDLARDFYLIADYRTALDRLQAVLDGRELSDEGLLEAHALRARALIGLGRRDSGVSGFCSVLRLEDDWRPGGGIPFTGEELAAFDRAVQLSLPLVTPPPPRARSGPPVATLPSATPRLGLESASPGGLPWYRRPLVLGAVGGLAAGLLVLVFDEEAPPPPAALPDFPEPPE
jgi:hypothetical protein